MPVSVAPKPNFANKTLWTGDNLPILRGMNSECVDVIYLDPPFNSNANYAAPVGSRAAGATFKDTWGLDDVDIEWINLIEAKHPQLYKALLAAFSKSDTSYLIYMAIRLLEMHRLLKATGSMYLHCDPTMSHYLKVVMDAIFGRKNFRNEIVWGYRTGGISTKRFPRKHDILLLYGKSQTTHHHPLQERIDYERPFFTSKVDEKGIPYADVYIRDVWDDVKPIINMSKEREGYPTQKPLALLHRVIRASTKEGDVILDPFCGCGTTLVAAEGLQREWIGIDLSSKAVELVISRIKKHQGLWRKINPRTDIPLRTDLGKLISYKSPKNKKKLYEEQQGNCAGCKASFDYSCLEVDYIIATSKGGINHLGNLQLLCSHCNRVKGNKGIEYLKSQLNFLQRDPKIAGV